MKNVNLSLLKNTITKTIYKVSKWYQGDATQGNHPSNHTRTSKETLWLQIRLLNTIKKSSCFFRIKDSTTHIWNNLPNFSNPITMELSLPTFQEIKIILASLKLSQTKQKQKTKYLSWLSNKAIGGQLIHHSIYTYNTNQLSIYASYKDYQLSIFSLKLLPTPKTQHFVGP